MKGGSEEETAVGWCLHLTHVFVEWMIGQFPLPALCQPTVHGLLLPLCLVCVCLCVSVSQCVYNLVLGKREEEMEEGEAQFSAAPYW